MILQQHHSESQTGDTIVQKYELSPKDKIFYINSGLYAHGNVSVQNVELSSVFLPMCTCGIKQPLPVIKTITACKNYNFNFYMCYRQNWYAFCITKIAKPDNFFICSPPLWLIIKYS
jgi:hypothetical protein